MSECASECSDNIHCKRRANRVNDTMKCVTKAELSKVRDIVNVPVNVERSGASVVEL